MRLVPEVALLDDATLERHAQLLEDLVDDVTERCGPAMVAEFAARGWTPRAILLGQLVAAALEEAVEVEELTVARLLKGQNRRAGRQ